jgi:fumarate reductase subunit D
MELSAGKIVGLVVALLLLGILLPIGIAGLEAFTSTNTNIQTLVATVIPIVAIIGIIMMILPKGKS